MIMEQVARRMGPGQQGAGESFAAAAVAGGRGTEQHATSSTANTVRGPRPRPEDRNSKDPRPWEKKRWDGPPAQNRHSQPPRHHRTEAAAAAETTRGKGEEEEKALDGKEEEHGPVYVVSFETDQAHHDAISRLRRQHFPEALLKVDAHLSVFHALPGDRLDDVRRVLESTAETIRRDGTDGLRNGGGSLLDRGEEEDRARRQYSLLSGGNTRKAGAAGATRKQDGRFKVNIIKGADSVRASKKAIMMNPTNPRTLISVRAHMLDALVRLHVPLTEQDQQERWNPHYTVGNFLSHPDEARAGARDVAAALSEPANHAMRHGTVQGLVLWRYVFGGEKHGMWVEPERFPFYQDGEPEKDVSLDTADEEKWPALGR